MEGSEIGQMTFEAELSKHRGPEEGRSPTPTTQANTNTVAETVAVTDGNVSQPEETTVSKAPLGTFSLASSLDSVKSGTGTLSTPGESAYSMNAADYSLGPAIGFGSSAIVYYANYLPMGTPVAIKMIELDHFERNQIDELRREIQVMTLCRHPNLLRVLSSFVHQAKLWIVTPYLSGGSCLDIMKTGFREGFEEPIIATILAQALRGLDYLHKNGHIHRDFKAGNLLMDEEGCVQLADFGVSSCLSEDVDRRGVRKTFVGTPCWMAPEVMEMSGRGYDGKADIWSFGITALELAYGQAPFSRYPPMKVIYMTLSGAPPTLDRQRAKYRYSRTFKEMIDACLHKDPNKRPTAELLLKHPFFRAARKKYFLMGEVLARVPSLQDRPRVKRLIKQVNDVRADEVRERETFLGGGTLEGDADKGKYDDEGEDVPTPAQWEFSSDYGVRGGLDGEDQVDIVDSSTPPPPGHGGVEHQNYSTETTTDMPGISTSTGGTLTKSSRFVVESNKERAAEEYDEEKDENGDITREPTQASPLETRTDDGLSTTATSATSTNPKDPALNEEDEETTIKKGRFSVLESATPTGAGDTPPSSSSSSSSPAQPATSSLPLSNAPCVPPSTLPEECEEGRRSRFQVETTTMVMGATNGASGLTGSPLVPQTATLAPQSSSVAATLTSSRFEVSTTGATMAVPVGTEPSALTAEGDSSMAHPMAHPVVAHLLAHTGRPYGHSQHQHHPSIYSENQSQFEYSGPMVARSSLPPISAVPRNGSDFAPMYQYQHQSQPQHRSYGQQYPLPPSSSQYHQHYQSTQLTGALQVHPSQIDQLLLLNELMRQQLLELRHSPLPPPLELSWNSHAQHPPPPLPSDSHHLGSTHSTMRDYSRDWPRGISVTSPSALASGNVPPPFYPSRTSMYGGVPDADQDFEEDPEDNNIMLPPPLTTHYTNQGIPLVASYSPHPSMGGMTVGGTNTMTASSLLHCHKRRSFSIDHRYRPPTMPSMSGNISSIPATGPLTNGAPSQVPPSHFQSSFASQVQTISGAQDLRPPHQQHRSVQSLKSPTYHHNSHAIGGDSVPILSSGNEPPPFQAGHHYHPLHYAHSQNNNTHHHPHHHQSTPMPLTMADDVASARLYRGEASLDPVESMRRQLEALQRENQQLRKQQGS